MRANFVHMVVSFRHPRWSMVFLFMAYATALMVVLRVPVSRLLAAGAGRSSILGALFYMPFYSIVNGVFGGVICAFPPSGSCTPPPSSSDADPIPGTSLSRGARRLRVSVHAPRGHDNVAVPRHCPTAAGAATGCRDGAMQSLLTLTQATRVVTAGAHSLGYSASRRLTVPSLGRCVTCSWRLPS